MLGTAADDDWAPFLRKGEEVASYTSTFGVLFNGDDPIDSVREDNYRKFLGWYSCSLRSHVGNFEYQNVPFFLTESRLSSNGSKILLS